MIKKVLLYGLSFGSAATALVLIHFLNGLYKTMSAVSLFSIIGQIAIVVLAVIFCIRSVRREFPESANLGKILLSGFFVAALVGAFTVSGYAWVTQNKPEILKEYRDQISLTYQNHLKSLKPGDKVPQFDVEDTISVGGFARSQMFLFISVGMLVSSAIGLRAVYSKK